MFLKNMNKMYLWVVALIFTIAVITAFKFDKFSFSFSSGKVKTEVKGEQMKNQDVNNYHLISSASKASTANEHRRIIQTTNTKGDQSPAVNNLNSTSTINYGSK